MCMKNDKKIKLVSFTVDTTDNVFTTDVLPQVFFKTYFHKYWLIQDNE